MYTFSKCLGAYSSAFSSFDSRVLPKARKHPPSIYSSLVATLLIHEEVLITHKSQVLIQIDARRKLTHGTICKNTVGNALGFGVNSGHCFIQISVFNFLCAKNSSNPGTLWAMPCSMHMQSLGI